MTDLMTPKEEKSCRDDEENDKEILIKKLQMKTEVLILISQELEQCKAQRDQFKLIAKQLQEKFLSLKTQVAGCQGLNDKSNRVDSIEEIYQQNKYLKSNIEVLKKQLNDAKTNTKGLESYNKQNSGWADLQDVQLAPAMHQREEMIQQLEKLNMKCSQLHTDLQSVVDEKHELVIERDAFKCKAHRLNHELSKALNASEPVDLDALINENRFLQKRLQQCLEEKELARQSQLKYKSMLESKKVKGALKLGCNSAAGTIMTHKQVEQLLQQGGCVPPKKSAAAVSDLHCLCSALLEALNDKTLALAHQRKANKILALRICELDSAQQSPTTKLLEGYAGANVDVKSGIDLDHSNCEFESVINSREEHCTDDSIVMENNSNSVQKQIVQQMNCVHTVLPKNLGILVQKALNSLKDHSSEEK